MSLLKFLSYYGFVPLFVFIIAVESIVFLIVCKFKNERKWNKRFYKCVEVFEDAHVEPSVVWSFLTDPKKFMNFNYRNKIKWVKFEQPLRVGSAIRIRIRNGYGFKGFLYVFDRESKIVFEYHVWPIATRYICEIEMVRLEDKTRYVLRFKVKKLVTPLIIKIFPKIDEKMRKLASDLLHNCLLICERQSAEKESGELMVQDVETPVSSISSLSKIESS